MEDKTKVKIVKLCGGLGNQMFQYAFGQELEYRFGCEVHYDDYWYQKAVFHFTEREYELHLFPKMSPKIASRQEILDYFKFDTVQTREDITQKMKIDTNPFVLNNEMFEDNDVAYYNGYFQTEKYFEHVKHKIKEDFTLPEIPKEDKINTKLLNELKNSNSVFIHIRRGDYLKLGIELNLEYYQKAIEYMLCHLKNPQFYVFGIDSNEWLKKFKIKYKFKFIGEHNKKNNEDWKDLKLMSSCRHSIIANSTFSWWAAYLSYYDGKIVIAPSPWLKQEDGIICENWVKIYHK